MTVIDWPASLFKATTEDWHLSGQTMTSVGIYGPGTTVHFENRIWMVEVPLTRLLDDELREVRSILDEARGQFGVIRVPVLAPLGLATGAIGFDSGVRFDGDVLFSDVPTDRVTVADDTPAGATVLRLRGLLATRLRPATMFTLPDGKHYRIARNVEGVATINPPLRKAVLKGARVEIEKPTALMRLTQDDASLTRVPKGHSSPSSFTMIEALT